MACAMNDTNNRTNSMGGVKMKFFGRHLSENGSIHSPTLLPWDKFSNWIHCIAVVTFDLELGQALEMIYPAHVKLSEQEKINICYLSFPDSNSGCMGDTQFHFRVRHFPVRGGLNAEHKLYNQKCPVALQIDSGYFYGYVYFRQVKDRSVRRGYFQKSLVILSRLPLVNLFNQVNTLIAPEFFDNGEPSIEAACHDIDHWPSPTPGESLSLPLLGTVLQVQLPSNGNRTGLPLPLTSPSLPSSPSHMPPSPSNSPLVIPSVHEIDLFQCLSPVLLHIHLLWELVLTAEPIVVMSALPTTCSQMVQALASIITPLRFCADFRPFFTIHDNDFKEYTTKAHAPPPVILGVTNPFFAKTLQHWPHIIRVGDSPSPSPHPSPLLQSPSSGGFKHRIKKGGNAKMLDSKPGVYTHYKPFLHKDKAILKKLLKGVQMKRPREVQSALLRRHLLELTQSFMIPLERYMASLMPLQKNISPYKSAPSPRPFNPDDFLATLETSGPQLTSGMRGDWVGLYRRFFRSVNFSGWYNLRYREVSQKLQALQLQALSDADVMVWLKGKQEVEAVDMVLRLKDKLEKSEEEELPLAEGTRERLQGHIEGILHSLPDDLRAVLNAS